MIIKTIDQLNELVDYIHANDFLSFDTETTGVDKESKIIGYSVSADYDTGYYVILRSWNPETQQLVTEETESHTADILRLLVGKNLIMHNAIFDCWMVNNNYNLDLMPSVHTDTLMLAHLLNENRHNGLKELAVHFFGDDSKTEKKAMDESITKNGGSVTKACYEIYKGDAELIGKYGAKDAILTIKLFYLMTEQLLEEGLDKFFYEDESMPLLRGPTYDLNTTGLRIDPEKLQTLKSTLEADMMQLESFIHREIEPHVKDKYPATNKKNKFNIGASQQLSWLLFEKLGNEFGTLTDTGKEICKSLGLRLPYAAKDKRDFISLCREAHGQPYEDAKFDHKKQKMGKPKLIGDYWKYLKLDKIAQAKLASKYEWVKALIEYRKAGKLLDTYVIGIQTRMNYNIIRPSFLQHGTTSGRYSSRGPNFQNLPREDKRVKSCIVAREGKVFVGADYSQLEPRVFASVSQDKTLMECFAKGEDFYSVVGAPIFGKTGYSLYKDDKESFAKKFPQLRDKSKVIALATPYGRTPSLMASAMNIKIDEARELIEKYFEAYPSVELMMLDSHEQAKRDGKVVNLFGRPRRIPEATQIVTKYGHLPHSELPYEARTLLNLGMNHRVQSSAASIMNRAAIAVWKNINELSQADPIWREVKIVMQVHDELILEGPEEIDEEMRILLKECMQYTVVLPGVDLIAEPVIGKTIADLK